jgi:signal transduction histidine kinase
VLLAAAAVLVLRVVRAWRSWPGVTAAVGGVATAIGAAVLLAHRAGGGSATTDHVSRVAWAVTCGGIVVVAAAPLYELVRVWIETTRIVDAVLAAAPSADTLRATLAMSAADDALAIEFPGTGSPPAAAATTDVVRAGEVIARLHHRELQQPVAARLTGAVRAAGLAIEHVAARARLRAQLDEVTASRARIVAVADAERQRLERNLHDGAQQRLIALSVALAGRNGAATEARTEVLAALEDLRTLAHGIHPASLTEGGVATSTRELADAARVPLRLDVQPVERLPPAVEAAAYRVIADSVRAAERSGRAVGVELATTDRKLVARLRLTGVPPAAARRALGHATDRVVAVGGTVDVREGRGETLVEVKIECGS